MKILYIINSGQYNYHKELVCDFTDVVPGEVIDISNVMDLGSTYHTIDDMKPDVVITFDIAGHVLRTASDSLSLNNIYARMAHILFHKAGYYGKDLKARQNLSMFTYIPHGEDEGSLRKSLTEVPNISEFVNICYKPYDDNEHESNRKNIKLWWDMFKREAML